VSHARGSDTAEGHRLHVQIDVGLIDRSASVREFANEAVDRLLVAAEDEGRQRMGGRGNLAEGFIQRLICRIGRIGPNTSSSMIGSLHKTGYTIVGSR
jgi:hypothetical protein